VTTKPKARAPGNPRLRAEAEARLARAPKARGPVAPAERLLHELQVHQIELETQNDELRRSQVALEESRDRYLDLYEFAPVGYLTVTAEGLISEVNLTGTALLHLERKK
jgi:PAS domain-containing protein